jgi:hypothetical protein
MAGPCAGLVGLTKYLVRRVWLILEPPGREREREWSWVDLKDQLLLLE